MIKLARQDLSRWLLCLGLAFVFAYASIAALKTPTDWVGYLPSMLRHSPHAMDWLKAFSIFEILLAIWLASGWRFRYSGGLTALMMLGIILAEPSQFAITFRDVGLLAAGGALAAWPTNAKV